MILNYGRVKFDAVDEDKNPRAVRGSVSMVHKPLWAAGEMSQKRDAVIWERRLPPSEGGADCQKAPEGAHQDAEQVRSVGRRAPL
eukprot:13079464-Heterocapsa_arctica.AAC.1